MPLCDDGSATLPKKLESDDMMALEYVALWYHCTCACLKEVGMFEFGAGAPCVYQLIGCGIWQVNVPKAPECRQLRYKHSLFVRLLYDSGWCV